MIIGKHNGGGNMPKSIVDIRNMGDALRNTGYKNIESAVSEIVDNSVEAEAENIFIIIRERLNTVSGRQQVSEIGFLDNGYGMDEEILSSCLGIGATTRKTRKGMGRFGVGLPQASLYACPEIEVYSWQNGIENCKMVYLDINKIKDGSQTEIADPQLQQLPASYQQFVRYKTITENYDFVQNGTLVIWKNCDRIQPKTRGPLVDRLEFALGQKFRYFINKEKCNMKIICENNQEMAMDIYPNDPLFLMENNYVLGNPQEPAKAYIKKLDSDLEPFFEPYTVDGKGDGSVDIPVKYYDKEGEISEASVKVRFSIVKDKFYDETAFKAGTKPGSYQFGKKYAKRMEGISVIRADREIDFRKFDFYENTNEPQHRWWGCEIIFDPILDEAFGVANNKQYVELKSIEQEDIDYEEEVQPLWLQLYSTVAKTIRSMYAKNEETRKKTRTIEGTQTATVDIINDVEENEDEDTTSTTKEIKENTPEEKLIDEGKKVLVEQGFEEPTDDEAKRYISNSVNFKYMDCGKFGPAFDYSFKLSCIIITINTSHDFYKVFLSKLYENDNDAKTTFELFLASFVKAVDVTDTYQRNENDRLVATWQERLKKYITQQLNPKKN